VKHVAVFKNVLFVERPPNTLGRSALKLPFDVGRMNRFTHVLKLGPAEDFYLAGFGVDGQIDQARAKGRRHLEATRNAHSLKVSTSVAKVADDLPDVDRALRIALHLEVARFKDHLVRVDFEHPPRPDLKFGDGVLARLPNSYPRRIGGAAPAGAVVKPDDLGVAHHRLHFVHLQPQLFRDDLSHGRAGAADV